MIDIKDFIIKVESDGKSRKLYKAYCDACKVSRGYKRKTDNSYCRPCFCAIARKGKPLSEETKLKIKLSHLANNGKPSPRIGKIHSESTKQLLSEKQATYCKEHGNQFVTGKSRGVHTEEVKIHLSQVNSGKEPRWRGRTFLYSGPKGIFKMRSSYELFYANYLDGIGQDWEYEPKFKLSNGKIFSPDFQLTGGDIIETKGYWTEVGKTKWELFCQDFPTVKKKVLMKEDLVLLGLKVK